MRDVAISSWALVIFLIDPADRIRRRSSRSVAAMIRVTYFFFDGRGAWCTFTDSLLDLVVVHARRRARLGTTETAVGAWRSPS